MMRLVPLNAPDLLAIAENMREWDKREIYGTRFCEDPRGLVRDCLVFPEMGWIAGFGDEPVAAIGAVPCWPGVWSVWMFATPKINKIGLSLTKFVRYGMIPALLKVGCHRAECHSMRGHIEAQRWLELLGARRESLVPRYGKHAEDFFTYSWTADLSQTDRYVQLKQIRSESSRAG